MNYAIKKGYESRLDNWAFDDSGFTDEFQNSVYEYAAAVTHQESLNGIADVGCGSGYKLMKFFSGSRTVGVEIEPTLSFIRSQWPTREWRHFSDGRPGMDIGLVICADVIEHLVEPNLLMDYLVNLTPQRLIISTPERDLLNDLHPDICSRSGPPKNVHHVREWNGDEFSQYVSRYFRVRRQFIVDGAAQVLDCEPRR